MRAILLPLVLLVSACATYPAEIVTEQQRIEAECQYEADKASPDNPLIALDLKAQCLRLKRAKV